MKRLHCSDAPDAPAAAEHPDCDWRDSEEPISTAPTSWHPLTQPLLWQGSEEDALQPGAPTGGLAPAWRLMLLSNGSVTRHLQLLTGLRVELECLEMRNIGGGAAGLPAAARLIPGPLVQRQVFLRSPEHAAAGQGAVLVYAASWWSAAEVDSYLADKALPIWASLSAARTELYHDIRSVSCGSSPFLQQQFGQPGPFWGRQYLFWRGERPLTLIHEVFSPALQRFLGPLSPDP
ncbi:hypothetical protein WJX81_007781 [Elliptochloris bilobata]|uniref:Chorismate lyase n=1 Tax=Elliptochloris bilobata TaxID=381761 RepID=A0AAW1SDZ8_9CHLO